MFRFRFALPTVLLLALIGCGGITPIQSIEKESTVTSTPKENQASVDVPTLTATSPSKAVEIVFDVASSRDKQNIAVFTSEGIYLYDSATLSLEKFIEFQTEIPTQNHLLLSPSITFSPDGKRLEPVCKIRKEKKGCNGYHSGEISSPLLVTSSNPSELLKAIDKPLNKIALAVM